nr:S-layer homology domain-containing protein [Paenibacillus lemnae]
MRYSYDDVISHNSARNEIEMALSRGFLNARDTAEFNSHESVTRGEFATMLVKILDIPLDYPSGDDELTFQDVGRYYDYRWDYRYIETAVRKGIVRGTAPRAFLPGQPLKREDAAVMIARAMNLKLGTYEKDLAALQKSFTDSGKIASRYSVTSIQAVIKAKVMNGIQNELQQNQKKPTYRFDPQQPFTRAHAASIAVEVAKKMKKL